MYGGPGWQRTGQFGLEIKQATEEIPAFYETLSYLSLLRAKLIY
jgi:hypothetical protein